jgi:hypothetical protein
LSKLYDQLKKAAREWRARDESRARDAGAPSLLGRSLAAQKAPAADAPGGAPPEGGVEASERHGERSHAESMAARRARDGVSGERRERRQAALSRVGRQVRPTARLGAFVLVAAALGSVAWLLVRGPAETAAPAASAAAPELRLDTRLDLSRLASHAS